jgi:hypothetical protein
MPPKKQMVLKSKVKVKILDVFEGDMSLAEVGWCYGKNESSPGF